MSDIIEQLKEEVAALKDSLVHWQEIQASLNSFLDLPYKLEKLYKITISVGWHLEYINFGSSTCACCKLDDAKGGGIIAARCSFCPLRKYTGTRCVKGPWFIFSNTVTSGILTTKDHIGKIRDDHVTAAQAMCININIALKYAQDKLAEEQSKLFKRSHTFPRMLLGSSIKRQPPIRPPNIQYIPFGVPLKIKLHSEHNIPDKYINEDNTIIAICCYGQGEKWLLCPLQLGITTCIVASIHEIHLSYYDVEDFGDIWSWELLQLDIKK